MALVRVSTEEQGRSGLGIEAQSSSIEEFCSRKGIELLCMYREHVSGSAQLEDRAGLLSALAFASMQDAVLVVAKRDRLSRDPFVSMLVERQCRVLSADGTADGDDPAAVFQRRILDAVAELERRMIAARTKAALQAKKERGEKTGRPPYGFRFVNGVLEEHPEQYRIFCRIVESHNVGYGYKKIADWLNERGFPAQSGGKWHVTQVKRVVQRAKEVLV